MSTHTVAGLIEQARPLLPFWEEVTRAVSVRVAAGAAQWCFAHELFSPAVREVAARRLAGDPYATANAYALARFITEGPKVFRPTAAQAEAAENVEVNVPLGAYRQPFPVMAVEFPPDLRQRRAVPDGTRGSTHAPYAVLVAHEPAVPCLVVSVLFDSDQAISVMLHGTGTVEHAIRAARESWDSHAGSAVTAEAEETLTARAARLALNALLLLAHYGSRQLPADNPSHETRLRRNLDKARRGKGKGDVARALAELRLLPEVHGFAQEVRLHDTAGAPHDRGPPTGATVKPHWRRGHWRNQPVGTGRTGTRLVFVRPCLVHAEQVHGPLAATAAAYRPPEKTAPLT